MIRILYTNLQFLFFMLLSKHLVQNGVAYITILKVYLEGYNGYSMHCYARH